MKDVPFFQYFEKYVKRKTLMQFFTIVFNRPIEYIFLVTGSKKVAELTQTPKSLRFNV